MTQPAVRPALAIRLTTAWAELMLTLQNWPWLETLRTLRQRFREDRLGLTAGSLTFTTLIALVPLLTVMLAVFSAFPYFGPFKVALEQFFLQNLVPDDIAKPVMVALTRFAGKASGLGTAGMGVLVATAVALMLTIDRTLNSIWRVRRQRPLAQRVLIYWAALTLGPLLMGASLSMTSVALSASKGLIAGVPWFWAFVLDALQFVLLGAAATGLFRYVPHTHVEIRHAMAGGLFVATAFEVVKKLLSIYLSLVPTYGSVYGTFAVVPILLLWTYLVWVIMLLGAVVSAYAPTLRLGVARRAGSPGWRFELALQVLGCLRAARTRPVQGLTALDLAAALRVDPLQVEPLLDLMVELRWVGRLDEEGAQRHVLLADERQTALAPLVERLLLADAPPSRLFRQRAGFATLQLSDVLTD
jgi:membrane protein